MKTRRALVWYGIVLGILALILSWWAVFFVRQGGVLVERANQAGAELSALQAAAVEAAAHRSLRMFLYEGSFLFLVFVAGVGLMLRAMRREILLSRQQRDFLSAVTHELRTPLSSARLAIQSLALGRVVPEKRERYLANAEADLARLSELVERVLETARVATSHPSLFLEPIDLAEFVRERAPTLGAEESPMLEMELAAPQPILVKADASALETLLRNLLGNAAKYASDGGRVRLQVDRDGGDGRLLVRDWGPGVQGDPKRLFEAFVRGREEHVKKRSGVGLGLYLVGQLVRGLGGKVAARNAPTDGGLEIEIRLPLVTESGA